MDRLRAFVSIAILLASASAAVAGPPAGTMPAFPQEAIEGSAPSSPAVTWRVAVGLGTLWIRDVASSRFGQHVDASPVSWEGHGAAVAVSFDHATPRRLHRLEVMFERTGDAVLRTPIAEVPRNAGDGGFRLSGRYEYRRYLFEDLGVKGLDIGFGAQGGAEFASITQHFDPSFEQRLRETTLAGAVVAAARFRRWRRVQVEVSWVNGGAVVRVSRRHSAAAATTVGHWGVGWLTDVAVRADVRLSPAAAIFASYFQTGRGRFVTRDAAASGRRLWMVGVSYGR
jgi:hypothetical protein